MLELVAVDAPRSHARRHFRPVRLGKMKRAPVMEKSAFRETDRRAFQEIGRCSGQLRDFRSAVAFKEEGRGTAGRVIAALIFGFDDQCSPSRGNFGAKARACDAAADNEDIEVHGAGYELESRTV
jgi:hypothetical protein